MALPSSFTPIPSLAGFRGPYNRRLACLLLTVMAAGCSCGGRSTSGMSEEDGAGVMGGSGPMASGDTTVPDQTGGQMTGGGTTIPVQTGGTMAGGGGTAPEKSGGLDAGVSGGNTDTEDGAVAPPPPPRVVINEVVTTPIQDWSSSDHTGIPFRVPGTGRVSGTDQYVELKNLDDEAVDLRGFRLIVEDGSPATTVLGQGTAQLVFSGSSRLEVLAPGDFVVIGGLEGYTSTDALITLHDAHRQTVDRLEIGGNTARKDYGRNGIRNGAPGPGRNGYARGAFEEAIARPIGADNPAAVDFVAMRATPGRDNVPIEFASEAVPPEILSSVGGSNVQVTGPFFIRFNESIAGQSVFGSASSVTMWVGGNAVAMDSDYSFTFSSDDPAQPDRQLEVSPIGRLPFSTDVEIRLKGGPGGLTDLAGNALPADVVIAFRTEDAPSAPADVVINELCVTPVRDWNDDEGGDGVPFNGLPGDGLVDSADEWIELLNVSGSALNLEDHRITIYNGPTLFGSASSTLTVSAAESLQLGSAEITAIPSGGYVIIGNPPGSLSMHTFVTLRDGGGRLVDFVEVGGTSPANDRGGDGLDNGAPSPGETGNVDESLSYADGMGMLHYPDEVVARKPNGADTGDDVVDFVHQEATPGSSNDP